MILLQLQIKAYYIAYKLIFYWHLFGALIAHILPQQFLPQNPFESFVYWLIADSSKQTADNMEDEEMQVDNVEEQQQQPQQPQQQQAIVRAPAAVRLEFLPRRMRRAMAILRPMPAPPHNMLARLLDAMDDEVEVVAANPLANRQVIDVSDDEDDDDDYSNDSDTESISSSSASSDGEYETFGRFSHITRSLQKHKKSLKQPMYAFRPFHLYRRTNTAMTHPQARSGHRVVATDSHLYSLGGYNPKSRYAFGARHGQKLFQELWAFNFADDRWELLCNEQTKNMPSELASNALVMHKNVLIAYGGTGFPFGESCSNQCVVMTTELKKNTIHRIPVTGDLPIPQYGPCIVIHGNYLYTIGGTTGYEYFCDVYRLDLRTNIWEKVYNSRPELREDPEGRYRHEVIYDGKHIFVLGGGTSNVVFGLQRLPAFNLQTNRWDYFETLGDGSVQKAENGDVEQPGFPRARKCFTCVQHNNYLGEVEAFITGGLQADSDTFFSDIWRLNVRSMQWTLIRTAILHKPLYFHAAAQTNGCMYIFGGIEFNNGKMRRRKDLFKMWMTIPKLSDMCWDALIFYNGRLGKQSRSNLLKAGIPKRYVERLPVEKGRMRYETV